MTLKRRDEQFDYDDHPSVHHSQHIHYHQCCEEHQQLERRPSGLESFLKGFLGGYLLMSLFGFLFGRRD